MSGSVVRGADGPPSVVALLAWAPVRADLEAGFEEEGVPLEVEFVDGGDRVALARAAASRSRLGLGVGADAEGLALVLAASPEVAYLEASPPSARGFGQSAARLAARRPV